MKPFKNKLAVTIVVLSVAFLGIITFSIKSNSTIISSGVGGVISPLQKIVYVVNEKVKESFEFFINLDRKSTRLNSSHTRPSRMPSSA